VKAATRRRVAAGAAAVLAAATALMAAARLTPTDAAWTDVEHVNAGFRARDCTDTGNYTTVGAGRFLEGSLLGTDLDTVAAAQGLTVVNDGVTATPSPATATPLGDDAYSSTLDVAVLGAQLPGVENALALSAPGQAAGIYDQYAQAKSTGTSAGAAGAVTDQGVVRVNEANPSPALPGTGSVHLGALVPAVAELADLRLELGAVAASSVLDACAEPATVTRDYGIAGLALVQDSALVAGLTADIYAALDPVQAAVDSLAGSNGLLAQTLKGLSGLGLATVTATIDVDLVAAVDAVMPTSLTDGAVTIDLAAGTITADVAALTGGPTGLNGLAPNTPLLGPAIAADIVARTQQLLDGLMADVVAAVDAELRAAPVDIRAVLLGLTVVRVTGTVQQVLDGTASVTLAGVGVGLDVLGPLAATITETLFGPTGAVATLTATLAGLVTAIVADLTAGLDALDANVSLLANVQPDQPGAPADPAPAAGAYRVSALRIGVTTGGGDAFRLATTTAGPNSRL
jgi:hypothetical protein